MEEGTEVMEGTKGSTERTNVKNGRNAKTGKNRGNGNLEEETEEH
jgi:hypothetical protein